MTKLTRNERQEHTELLANRLRTLLDIAEARQGSEVTYTQISEYLESCGVALSRARWSYMVNGHRFADDHQLTDALSDFFGVPAGYLRGDPETPDTVSAQLDLVRAMRAQKVKSFAARTLGDLSPETLNAITRFLDNEVGRAGTDEELSAS